MIKFVSILISVMSLNFMMSYTTASTQIDEVEVAFSNKAIAIESGQPVFTQDTKIMVSYAGSEKVKIYINDKEQELKDEQVEISGLEQGTYTLMFVAAEQEENNVRTVGFTIQ